MALIRIAILLISSVLSHGVDIHPLPHSAVLDPDHKFHISWDYNQSHIVFEVRVKTLGYVGLGFSPNGGMRNSDVVIGWVDDMTGEVILQDRHAIGRFEPVLDTESDYSLQSGSHNGTHTTLRFSRRLHLCSFEDFRITTDTVRVIWAYSDVRPQLGSGLQYHGGSRGVRSIVLLNPDKAPPPLPSEIVHVDLLNRDVLIPDKYTTYWCESFQFPTLSRKHHLIQVEPIIQAGQEAEVHHIVLYMCRYSSNASVGISHECYHPNMPEDWAGCTAGVFAWGVGGGAFTFPAHVGFPLGHVTTPMMFLMETHYDNPGLRSGIRDSSGLRLLLTPQLRQYDAGIVNMGVGVWDGMAIPPGYQSFLTEGHCSADCLSQAMGNNTQELKIFAVLLHSHLAGRKLRLRHFRNNIEQETILADNNYDFDLQEMRLLQEEVIIRKGDSALMQCVYSTEDRQRVTYGGLGTQDEMCLAFVLYYPEIALATCTTVPTSHYQIDFAGATADRHNKILTPAEFNGQDWKRFFESGIDWADVRVREDFQEWSLAKNLPVHFSVCTYGTQVYPSNSQVVPIPKLTFTQKEDTCAVISGSTCGRPSYLVGLLLSVAVQTVVVLSKSRF